MVCKERTDGRRARGRAGHTDWDADRRQSRTEAKSLDSIQKAASARDNFDFTFVRVLFYLERKRKPLAPLSLFLSRPRALLLPFMQSGLWKRKEKDGEKL